MKYLSLILILVLATPAQAVEVKFLKQGEPAPFTGFLFDSEGEKHFRLLDQKLAQSEALNKAYENLVLSYDKNETILNRRIEICQEQNEKLAKPKSDFGKYGHFLLGAATAILIMFAHGKINR